MIFWLSSLSILFAFWIYFFVYADRYELSYPWGFGIVFVGLWLINGIFPFHENHIVVFSIKLTLVVCLIGLFLNINNIKEQFYIRDRGQILRFFGIGLIAGLVFGFAMQIRQGVMGSQTSGQFTKIALVAASIQTSVAEEFLITGYFLGYLRKYGFNQILAIVFQALFFTFLHVPHYSGDWARLLIVFLIGLVSGYLVSKSNNLIPSFILHTTVNLIAVFWLLNIS